MSSILPFDIITEVIDNVGENEDTDLLKKLALVSHSFLQICSKHLFATVDLHDADSMCGIVSTKKRFVKLLKSRPDVVKYIRKLTYQSEFDSYDDRFHSFYPSSNFENEDLLLSPILPDFLRTISHLNSLKIIGPRVDWNTLDSTLTSAFLHLMHLPTINHIDLSFIKNFPLSSLTPSVNMHRLDIFYLRHSDSFEEDGSTQADIVVQSDSEMIPKIREFHTKGSSRLTTQLLHAKRQDGRPAFNFMDLRRLSMESTSFEGDQNIRYLLQNAKLLEKLHLSGDLFGSHGLVGLPDMLSPSARTLKVLDLTIPLLDFSVPLPLAGICEELEAMAGHYMLEALSFHFLVRDYERQVHIESVVQKVGKVLVKPGWSALKQVSLKVSQSSRNIGISPWQIIHLFFDSVSSDRFQNCVYPRPSNPLVD